MSGNVHNLGGVPIPLDRRRLNLFFWLFSGSLVFYLVFFNDAPVPIERLGESLALVAAILLPTWLWVSNRSQGLPIFPIYSLFFFPAYALPLCRGDSRLVDYTELEIATGAYTIVGFLLLSTLVWWQSTNRNLTAGAKVWALDPDKSTNLMLFFLFGGILFEFFGAMTGQSIGGFYQALRGYAQNGTRLAIFILFYLIGRGRLKSGVVILILLMSAGMVVQQASSIVLANSFPALGLAFSGYFLGSGRLPWKCLLSVLALIILLHSGKAEMRSIYYKEGVSVGLMDYPAFFSEWLAKGVINLTRETSTETVEVQNAKERASLLPLMLQIQKMGGKSVPYLNGATYDKLPSMLIPRVFSKEKAVSHIGNIIMAVHYGVLKIEDVWFTSIAFDLPIEAYANYGYLGVASLAVVMGLFTGLVSLMTTGVPLFSFRFLVAILVLSAVISSNNTMGVFVTTAWQGFLALASLSLLKMRMIQNPLKDIPVALHKKDERGSATAETMSQNLLTATLEKNQTRQERPKRFVYGKKIT